MRPPCSAPILTPGLDLHSASAPADVLEFHDPLRVETVEIAGLNYPLAANFGAANALAHKVAADRGPFALAGFALPSTLLDKADIRMLEPYQPGKIPVLFVHGLLADPFIFNDMMVALNRTPGLPGPLPDLGFPVPDRHHVSAIGGLTAGRTARRTVHVRPPGTRPGTPEHGSYRIQHGGAALQAPGHLQRRPSLGIGRVIGRSTAWSPPIRRVASFARSSTSTPCP